MFERSSQRHVTPSRLHGRRSARLMVAGRVTALLALVGLSPMLLIPSASATTHPLASGCTTPSIAPNEPSREAPPGVHWLRGYARIYCSDFPGTNLPSGWGRFSGVPQGDPSSMFDPSHVVVRSGILSLNTSRDAANGGKWATGGVCQCGLGRTYGTYLVRSRLTGAGDDEVQMLWPVAHVWPPEVDFNETGNRATKTAWYVHFRSSGHQIAKTLRINLTRWHTWGVRWTPRQLTFTVDGRVWGVVRSPSVIPHEQMTLDLSQQTWCGIAPECPTHNVSMQVDWVAIFAPR